MKLFEGFCSGLYGEHDGGVVSSKRRVVRWKTKREGGGFRFSHRKTEEEGAAATVTRRRSQGVARGGDAWWWQHRRWWLGEKPWKEMKKKSRTRGREKCIAFFISFLS